MKRLNFTPKSKRKPFAAILFAIMLLSAFPFAKSFSNNLTISNIVLDQPNKKVTFNLSWQNSWRKSDWTAKNWDAAWVFVKWRACSDLASVQFSHGLVSTNVGDHVFAGTTILEPTKRDGTAPGIDGGSDNTGVMLRRASDGTTGTVTATVTLNITNMPTSGTLDFRVFGVEMIFVPTNAYVLGDGDGYIKSDNSFTLTANPAQPNINSKVIINENSQTVSEATTTICNQVSGSNGSCDLTAAFPKGYAAFYIMKYEISQGQYTDFLNAVNTNAQSVHYPNKNDSRQSIIFNITPPTPYFAARPDRACNWLSWPNVSSYLDWAALRPLTEMEFEKACRGTEPSIPYQKAWGTTTGTLPAAGGISGSELGTETITTNNANVNANNIAWTSGDGNSISGPLRVGIFATGSTTSRVQTGMGFYGTMELSGNVSEYYISVLSGTSGNPSTGGVSPGDGGLNDGNGNHDNATWPAASPSISTQIIRRGGSWSTTSGNTSGSAIATNISYRGAGSTATADNASGGRGGR